MKWNVLSAALEWGTDLLAFIYQCAGVWPPAVTPYLPCCLTANCWKVQKALWRTLTHRGCRWGESPYLICNNGTDGNFFYHVCSSKMLHSRSASLSTPAGKVWSMHVNILYLSKCSCPATNTGSEVCAACRLQNQARDNKRSYLLSQIFWIWFMTKSIS